MGIMDSDLLDEAEARKDDNKDSGFYCMGCDDFRVELDCISNQQGELQQV